MNEPEKTTITLYKLNEDVFNDKTFDGMVNWIMSTDIENNAQISNFQEQQVRPLEEFDFRLFYYQKQQPPMWRDFFSKIVLPNSQINAALNSNATYVGFIGYKNNVFAFFGGQGNFIIQQYTEQNFGLEIICRILPPNHNAIKAIQDIAVFGSVLGSEKFFRGDYKLDDGEQFGKVYKSIISGVDKDLIISEFGFSDEELRRNPRILAKSSFQISKRIDFERMLEIIKKLGNILKREPNFILNKITHIKARGVGNKNLITKLKDELINNLFDIFNNNEVDEINICNKKTSQYLTASYYKVFSGRRIICQLESLDSIGHLVTEENIVRELDLNTIDGFEDSLSKLTIKSFNEEGDVLTSDKLLAHLHGELTYDDSVYFFLEGEWYRIDNEFIEDLDSEMCRIIDESLDDSILQEEFDIVEDEKVYNQKYLQNSEYVVLDRVIVDNIELCDLLKVKNGSVHLIHVKKGFNNSIRELTSQIELSALTLLTDMKKSFSYIKKLDEKIKSSQTVFLSTINNQPKSSKKILNLFKSKRESSITFSLAFVDTANRDREIIDIKKFKSNIAKFSIIELNRKLRSLGFNFSIIQITRKRS